MASSTRYYAEPATASKFATELLVKAGLSEEDAKSMADCLVLADIRDTHGLARLPQYLDRVSDGRVNARPNFKLIEKTPVIAHLDGDNGFGFVVATRAMESSRQARRDLWHRDGHRQPLQPLWYGRYLRPPGPGEEHDLSGFHQLGQADASIRWQGDSARYLAICCWLPRSSPRARSAVLRRGETIPLGWALDADGNPTTDADVALNGSMAPIGGPKGSGIAILMDVMSGVLAGAAFGGEVGDQYKDPRPQNARMDVLVRRVHGVTPAPGFNEVLFPGESERRLGVQRRREGIPYADAEKQMFVDAAKQYGVAELPLSEAPLALT